MVQNIYDYENNHFDLTVTNTFVYEFKNQFEI